MDNCVWGTIPPWDCGDIVPESGVVHLVDEDAEESGGLFIRVGLELGIDLDDEGGSHDGEQTGLSSELARVRLPSNAKD